ncbi:MAG: lamin tail domain-containing protein [Patescibacteria group bacterium]
MVLINEWLPNPEGADADGEWLELINSGDSAANLSGWKLVNSSGKKFIFGADTVSAHGYLLLPRSRTKLTLKNQNEHIMLYNAQGRVADESSFPGSAPEGMSLSRVDNGFVWASPTPMGVNSLPTNTLALTAYPPGSKFNSWPDWGPAGLALLSAALLTAAIFFIIKNNYGLYKLLFRGDEKIRL